MLRRLRLGCLVLGFAATIALSGCATRHGPAAHPEAPSRPEGASVLGTQEGLASYYGREFQGRRMANGRRFDMRRAVAAHPSYPLGTRVRITNLANHRRAIVTIADRGPAAAQQAAGIVIDVSRAVAEKLAFVRAGHARVRLEVLEWGRD